MRQYRTIQGDTWDMIAFREYPDRGGEKLMSVLIEANEDYADIVKFPAGIILNVPEVAKQSVNNLPPWKD